MTDTKLLLATAIALLGLGFPALAADGPPNLDVDATCKSAMRAQSSVGDNATVDGCLRSERDAQKEAERRWGDYSPAAKTQCEQQFKAGGYPSYVEMVTCLELASGTVPTQPKEAGSGATPEKETAPSTSVAKPNPGQRTNPIDVLNK